jgi:hypothetical protein
MTDGSSNGQEPIYDLRVGIDDLDLADVEEIEDRTGRAIDNMTDDGTPKAKLVRALFYVQMRRERPDEDPNALWVETGKIKLSRIKQKDTETVPPIAADA